MTVKPFHVLYAACEVSVGDVLYESTQDTYHTVTAVANLGTEVRIATDKGALVQLNPLDEVVVLFTPKEES